MCLAAASFFSQCCSQLMHPCFSPQSDVLGRSELDQNSYIRFLEAQLHQHLTAGGSNGGSSAAIGGRASPPPPRLQQQLSEGRLEEQLVQMTELLAANSRAAQQQQGLQQAALLQVRPDLHPTFLSTAIPVAHTHFILITAHDTLFGTD